MKCPNCGYNSFDHLEECKKCKLPLNPSREYKSLYKRAGKKAPVKQSADVLPSEGYKEPQQQQEVPIYHERRENPPAEEPTKAKEPEISSAPSVESEVEGYSEDPLLYSESQGTEDATNLTHEPADAPEQEESFSIAGLKQRAAAFVIDILIVGLITYITIESGFYFMQGEGIGPSELDRVFMPIYMLLFFLASTYFIFLHYYTGSTVGKMALGIRIINSDGTEVGLWESFMRWVGYYVSAVFLLAGFVWSIFDPDSQAWHDKIAGTYVVKG